MEDDYTLALAELGKLNLSGSARSPAKRRRAIAAQRLLRALLVERQYRVQRARVPGPDLKDATNAALADFARGANG